MTYAHSAIFSSPACSSKFVESDSRMSEETSLPTRLENIKNKKKKNKKNKIEKKIRKDENKKKKMPRREGIEIGKNMAKIREKTKK